uniref:Serpin family G member 1 n=1 Tax=Sphenodon punctatus TaxID=8508 RepID=A0A8D0HHL5_SPHPU
MLLSYPEDFTCVHAAMKLLVKSEALISASTIFFHKDLNVTNVFLNQSQWFYNSRPMQLSSNNTYNLQSINKWVSDQTKDKIKRLLDDLSPDVQMVLLNAVYFHCERFPTWPTSPDICPRETSHGHPMLTEASGGTLLDHTPLHRYLILGHLSGLP